MLSLGQVFTPTSIVSYMRDLIRNDGFVLEPSCGNGAFLSILDKKKTTAIEKEKNLCFYKHKNIDFFDFKTLNKYQTIIGNPPYVKHNNILECTKKKLDYRLFDKRTNLYLFFIDKCINLLTSNGELIFITPRDFLKQTSSIKLNNKLFELGGFTHFKDFGDERIFENYNPNCAIWRWQKNLKKSLLDDGRVMECIDGQIIFKKNKTNSKKISNFFTIKVGAVSGADAIFSQKDKKATDFVCSSTFNNGTLKRMLYNTYSDILLPFKKKLISRKIKNFNEKNWWEWGRKYPHKKGKRIYVNCKTRRKKPFFISDVPAYDGSVLALFPKKNVNLSSMCNMLNMINWDELGFQCGGRYIFSQRSLENLVI